MKLSYRGVRYDREPTTPLEMTERDILGTYRGQSYSVRYPRHMSVAQPVAELTYRGVPYRTTANGTTEAVERTSIPSLTPEAVESQLAQVHQDNLCKRLSARIAAARERGDVQLLQMLERESQELVCSR